LDTNGDGILTKEKFIAGYKKIAPSENAEAEVEAILKIVGKESSVIDPTDFILTGINRQQMLSKERLEIISEA